MSKYAIDNDKSYYIICIKNEALMTQLKSKAEMVRMTIKESLEHAVSTAKTKSFLSWIDLGKQASVNKKHKFHSDNDLWK